MKCHGVSALLLLGALSAASSFTVFPPLSASVSSPKTFTSVQAASHRQCNQEKVNPAHAVNKGLAIGLVMLSVLFGPLSLVHPNIPDAMADSRVIGEIQGSGIFFKDTLQVESFDDPKVKGVTLYLSNFQRPINERLSKDFFSDPSAAAVGCAKTGPVAIADNIEQGKQGEQVFSENRSLLFKSLRVQRVYDKERNTMVYVVFNTRLDKNDDSNKSRYQSALCAVNLNEPDPSATKDNSESATVSSALR